MRRGGKPNLPEPRSSGAKLDTRNLLPPHIVIQGELLGTGTYGIVMSGMHTYNHVQHLVAIKFLQGTCLAANTEEGFEEGIEEAAVLLKLQ